MDSLKREKREFVDTIMDLCSVGYSDRIHVLLPFKHESIMCFVRGGNLMVFLFTETDEEYTDRARDIVIARVKKKFGQINTIRKMEIRPEDYEDVGRIFDQLDDTL